MGKFDAAESKQIGILKENTLEVHGKEMEKGNQLHTSIYYPQSFGKYVDSDNEEPEMDSVDDPEEEPEEDPEEDLVEEPEEDPEEEVEEDLEMDGISCNEKVAVECACPFKLSNEIVSAEQLTEHEDEDSAAEFVFGPNPQGETAKVYQNMSDDKPRIVVNEAVTHFLSQKDGLGKSCKYDEPSKEEFEIKYAATGQHCVPGELEEAVVGTKNSGKQANSGKRRVSKWDQGPEDDKKAILEDRECKKGKTMWDANDSKSTLQDHLPLTDLRSSLCGHLLYLEIQSLRKRFLEISSILDPLVDDKLHPGVYAPEKLIKEREKIFIELAKRNATISKELYVPVKEYPMYNFIGLILGPKGNTQKRMELKTGARIRLRGKDLSKSAQEADPSEDEDLNVYIEAVSQKSLDDAVCMVEKLLIPVEDEMNDHKRAQLQELWNLKAESCISSCSVCKEPGHNKFACPLKKTTLKAACEACGSFSHSTSGCPVAPSNLKIKSSKEIDAANLYIEFLPQTVDDSRLRELFSPFGTITQTKVALNFITGYSMRYGFVRFDSPSAASLAILHMNGHHIDGHRLRVRIAGTPAGQPATSHLPIYSNSGPAAVATSYPSSPHYMMAKSQVSSLNIESTGLSSSLNMEYSRQISQTEAPIISQNISGSSESSSAYLSSGLASVSTGPSSAFSSTVATSSPALPHCMMQVSALNGEGLGSPLSINMDYLTNLYIGFLPQTVDGNRLWELFSPFGTITQLKVPLDQMGYSKGYGFVRFDTPSAASLAIMHMNGCEIDGHRLTVKIAAIPPIRGQLATNLLHVYPNPGPTAVPSSYPTSPYYMMREAQVSVLNGEGIGLPSLLESSNQLSQAEAPIVPQEVSGSTASTTAAGSMANITESIIAPLSTSLVSRSIESSTTYSPTGSVLAASTELGGAYPSTVATGYLALPDYTVSQAQLSVLDGEGLGYPSSLYMEYLSNLKIGFLPQTVDDSRLWELFSSFGTITQLKVALDRTGYSKGYGFVKFDNPSAASLAIMHMNGYEIDGHRLTVKIAGSLPVRGQPGTNLLHVYPNPGPAAVATSYPASPYYMMQKAQVSSLNGEIIGYPLSLNMESSYQFPQTEAPVIPQELSGSTTSISSTVPVSSLIESRTGLISGSTESPATSLTPVYSFPGPAVVASRSSAVPHHMIPKALQSEGVKWSTSSGSTESRTSLSRHGSIATSAESRSVISSYSFSSLFCSDSKYPGSGF
ncbi:uncharacterized protein LOC108213644 [Daucus carota subsp. sativus]|uniref:uncharacterized protein LOC108213644 n=1 Tax=Daucus carota subsp. sativus TaxID=79200 RepID=UPI003082F2D7